MWIWDCVSFLRVDLGVCFFSTCGFGSVFLFYMWIWECVSVRDYGGRCGSGLVGVVVLVLAVAVGGDHGCGGCCHRFRGCGFGRCDGIHHRWVVAGQDGLGHGGNGDCHDGGHDGSYRPEENMVHIFEIICTVSLLKNIPFKLLLISIFLRVNCQCPLSHWSNGCDKYGGIKMEWHKGGQFALHRWWGSVEYITSSRRTDRLRVYERFPIKN